jgi:hypothetical protein
MNYDFAPLVDKAVAQYKEKMARICLDCPHYPNDCPPKRCPPQTSVRLQPCATKATLFSIIRAHTSALTG